jgi:hypothetical protein
MGTITLKWTRRFPSSGNNFDLLVTNPQDVDAARMNELLNAVLDETHRGLTLSSVATQEFQRWFAQPTTALKSTAYVLLSNWFTTRSGDRHSMVASYCELLWDALFPCRPVDRLSSPEPGRNHVVVPVAFEHFWQMVLAAQGGSLLDDGDIPGANVKMPADPTPRLPEQLRATIANKTGLRCEVEGSPRALADFLQMVSEWQAENPDAGHS